MAQLFQVDDGHPAIFQPEHALLLKPLQALVGILPRQARQRADLFLGDLQMPRQVGIEDGVE